MTKQCGNCGNTFTLDDQTVGSQHTSDDKPNGPIYTTKCNNCGEKNTEKVQELINNE